VPVLDLNADGVVDADDVCIVVGAWGTDEPLCDIGPMPVGDGIVDVEDLIVLSEHLFTYPGAVAYWKLDEAGGDIAYDSVGVHDAVVRGDATWQPDHGVLDGALRLDGIDDYISTDFILNPEEGPFSVFCWIRGGDPGQVILAQADAVNWLGADEQGCLFTELTGGGRWIIPLWSSTTITDDNWHCVGLVWSGSQRTLYVDDVVVATDPRSNLIGSEAGLHIGASADLAADGFWRGLIDDVRVYTRTIIP
jgi:hypothetical protein